MINESTLVCTIPPLVNNSDPVFVEVCLSGHPDNASATGRPQRDDMCTSSLVRFEYVDVVRSNYTIWNTSVVAGPIAGGTDIKFFGKYGNVEQPLVDSAPEFDGLPDYGRPLCVFGIELGRTNARVPVIAHATTARLRRRHTKQEV